MIPYSKPAEFQLGKEWIDPRDASGYGFIRWRPSNHDGEAELERPVCLQVAAGP